MNVKLLDSMKIQNIVDSIRECYDSHDKSDNGGPADQALITRVIDGGHTSTLEHVNYHFKITDFSRALLQELSRHRMASPSVRSTRYTLKKMLRSGGDNLSQFLVMTGNTNVDMLNVAQLRGLTAIMVNDINTPNDILKYGIPEALKVTERLTINVRSLRNLLILRSSPRALWEFRDLAVLLLDAVPVNHMVLFDDVKDAVWKRDKSKLISNQ